MGETTQELARFAATLDYDAIPERVRAHCRDSISRHALVRKDNQSRVRGCISNSAEQLDIFSAGSLFAGQDKIEVRIASEDECRLVIGCMPNAPNQRV